MSKWEWKKLGEVYDFTRGLTYSKKDEVESSSNCILRSNNIDLQTNLINLDELKYIKDEIEIPQEKYVRKNTILICMSNGSKAHLGKVAYIDKDYDFAFGGFMGLLKPKCEINGKFVHLYLCSDEYKNFIKSLSDGANINNLKFDDLRKFEIPFPPLSEQKRIVKFLDNEFSKIETLKTNAETNLKNAKELFETTLEKETCSRMGWEIACAGDLFQLTDYVSNGSFASLKENVKYFNEEEYAVLIRLVDFSNNFDSNKFVYVNKHAYDFLSKSRLMGGELIMCNIGATIGKCFICPKLNKPMTLGPNCISVTTPNNRYFAYYFLSKNFKKILWKIINKTTLEKFNKTQFKTLQIPLPPLSVQKEIVARLDKLSENVKRLEANYKQIIDDCDELKKSILKQTFQGGN